MSTLRVISSTVIVTLALLCVGQTANAACRKPIPEGEDKICQVTVKKATGATNWSWGYLHLFQTYLQEKDINSVLPKLGCRTDESGKADSVECPDVANGLLQGTPKRLKKVTRLEYLVEKAEWNSNSGTIESLFTSARQAYVLEDPAVNEAKIAAVEYTEVAPPAALGCTDSNSYVQPCYTRAICTQYAGCSRSKFSCLQCPPAN